MKSAYATHLERLHNWLSDQPNLSLLRVAYAELITRPEHEARRVSDFLSGAADCAAMARAVDPSLYRNRTSVDSPPAP
jgi:acyl transferase domain-containing protein